MIVRLAHAIRNGWVKTTEEINEEKRLRQEEENNVNPRHMLRLQGNSIIFSHVP